MSAADWRKAMNAGATSQAWPRPVRVAGPIPARPPGDDEPAAAGAGLAWIARRLHPAHVVVLAALVVYQWVVSPFFTFQIGAQSLALGLIALSLTFLAGYFLRRHDGWRGYDGLVDVGYDEEIDGR